MRILGRFALSLLCVSALWFAGGCASGDSSSGGGATGAIGGAPVGGMGGTGLHGGTGGGGTGGTAGTVTGGTGATGGGTGASGGTGGWPGECSGAAEKPCYAGPPGTEGVGECKAGKQVCQSGTYGACQGAVEPAEEICDNLDNDCDGLKDEDLGQTKCGQGNCVVTVENCLNGVAQTCTPKPGNPTEACDGADDNCDGQVDEGCTCTDGKTQACYTGDPTTKGVGLCKAGSQTCTGGKWGTCTGEVLPATEKCNGIDEDCDGQADDGNPQSGQTCSTGKQGVCANGTTACQNSTLVCLQTSPPTAEQCNGLDDNCNGAVDDGNPGSGQTCSTGKPGVCSAGTTQCQAGKIACVQTAQPGTETCDTIDNDCDGQVDEGCNCVNGTVQGCYTGSPGTQGVGPCKSGTQTCVSGNWGACTGQVIPKAESCNNVDDNCNGQTDESNPGGGGSCTTGKPGICSAGTYSCQAGSLTCIQNQQPATETCGNGLDDNCNGTVDDGCSVTCAHDKCTIGIKLTSGCDPCVTQVCASDSYCCNTSWDSLCVSEVRTICKSLKCDEAKGGCAHSLCITGTLLASGCDSVQANCVSKICAVDSYCCTYSWDGICVGEVASVCANNCN